MKIILQTSDICVGSSGSFGSSDFKENIFHTSYICVGSSGSFGSSDLKEK